MVSTNSNDFKSQVLQAVNIVDLIGQSVALKKRGKDYVGLCPFHSEKTPSFKVDSAKQYFYCFGCKANGNAIDFVMKRDRIEFVDALRMLGEKAGLEMPKFGVSKEKTGERKVLQEVHSAACAFFEKLFSDPNLGAEARAYVEKRGINDDSVKRFQIGLAIESWDALLKSPIGKKYPASLLHQAGLVKPRERDGRVDGFYDTFRNRLMFPIRDENARVIAFGGRAMPGSQDPAKYLNSPETPLFSKSSCVFGLDLAKQRIVETRTVAVVEGYTDVVMAHQFGVTNVVSILGTAMTPQHLTIMRRFADRVVLLFDADTAGDVAVNRAVELFLTQPIEIAIASMPDGVDPDEFLLEHGAEKFELLLKDAADALTYKWKQLSRQYETNKGDMTAQQKAVEQYLELLAGARGSGPVDPLRWGSALARVSRLTDIPVDDLNRRFKAPRGKTKSIPVQTESSSEESQTVETKPTGPLTAQDRVERRLLGVLLAEPHRWHDVQQHVQPSEFTNDLRCRLAEIYWQHQRDEGEPVFNEFLGQLNESAALSELAVDLVDEIEGLDPNALIEEALAHWVEVRRRAQEQKLLAALCRTKDQGISEEEEVALLKQFSQNKQPNLHRLGPVRRAGQ